jgi:hypothetical protein
MNLQQTDCRQRENSNHQSYNENSARKAVGETEQQIDPKAENHGRKTESGSEGTRIGVLCRLPDQKMLGTATKTATAGYSREKDRRLELQKKSGHENDDGERHSNGKHESVSL